MFELERADAQEDVIFNNFFASYFGLDYFLGILISIFLYSQNPSTTFEFSHNFAFDNIVLLAIDLLSILSHGPVFN